MLAHRLRRWPNIEPTHGQCPVFAGYLPEWRTERAPLETWGLTCCLLLAHHLRRWPRNKQHWLSALCSICRGTWGSKLMIHTILILEWIKTVLEIVIIWLHFRYNNSIRNCHFFVGVCLLLTPSVDKSIMITLTKPELSSIMLPGYSATYSISSCGRLSYLQNIIIIWLILLR